MQVFQPLIKHVEVSASQSREALNLVPAGSHHRLHMAVGPKYVPNMESW